MWDSDISDTMAIHYCAREDVFSYNFSRVVFVDKSLADLARARIRETRDAAAAKVRKDI